METIGKHQSKANTLGSGVKNIPASPINKEFWEEVYSQKLVSDEPSPFAKFCLPLIRGTLVDLGCGNGRDLYYFKRNGIQAYGVDAANEDVFIVNQDVGEHMLINQSPDNVYARFFWHSIDRELQEQILDWTKGRIFIEARTTQDKPKNIVGKHKRNLVDVQKLKEQLEQKGFTILSLEMSHGFSPFMGEDPHLVRVVADKN